MNSPLSWYPMKGFLNIKNKYKKCLIQQVFRNSLQFLSYLGKNILGADPLFPYRNHIRKIWWSNIVKNIIFTSFITYLVIDTVFRICDTDCITKLVSASRSDMNPYHSPCGTPPCLLKYIDHIFLFITCTDCFQIIFKLNLFKLMFFILIYKYAINIIKDTPFPYHSPY